MHSLRVSLLDSRRTLNFFFIVSLKSCLVSFYIGKQKYVAFVLKWHSSTSRDIFPKKTTPWKQRRLLRFFKLLFGVYKCFFCERLPWMLITLWILWLKENYKFYIHKFYFLKNIYKKLSSPIRKGWIRRYAIYFRKFSGLDNKIWKQYYNENVHCGLSIDLFV